MPFQNCSFYPPDILRNQQMHNLILFQKFSFYPSHHIIPFTLSRSNNFSHAISTTLNIGSTFCEAATRTHSSSDKPENSITSFPGMSYATSSSTFTSSSSSSIPTHSTSSIPSFSPIPNHPVITCSKNNISKPTQIFCLSAALSP